MRKLTPALVLIALSFFATQSFADHSPKKMMRNIKAFSQLSVTGKLAYLSHLVVKMLLYFASFSLESDLQMIE